MLDRALPWPSRPEVVAGVRQPSPAASDRLFAVLLGTAIVYAGVLALAMVHNAWLFGPGGAGKATDFLSFWGAGRLALEGQASEAYDLARLRAAQAAGSGGDPGAYPWYNPPSFLLVVAPFALLPYTAALLAWCAATMLAYLAVARIVVPHHLALLGAIAFPATLACWVTGQSGFLTAALIGGALVTIDRRPHVAGILIGLLTIKPQLGIVLPVILIAGGRWRAFAAASLTALALAGLSALIFGPAVWPAFFASVGTTAQVMLVEGQANWAKFQSAFGLLRTLGVEHGAAVAAQSLVTLTVLVILFRLWRRPALPAAADARAAATVVGALLATPYLFVSDLTILGVAAAFLVRLGLREGFRPLEPGLITLAGALIPAFLFVPAQTGLAAIFLIGALALRRVAAA